MSFFLYKVSQDMVEIKTRLFLSAKYLMMNFYYRIDSFVLEVARKYDKKGFKLLDVGAGSRPYRKYFKKLEYYSQDVKQNETKTIDYVGDIQAGIKEIKKGSMDYILCTQVLEHLTEPGRAFAEFGRILKKKGKLFLTTNFFYQIHMAPNDYFRFTEYGLEYLARSNGFEIERIESQGGVFQVISYLLSTWPIRVFLKEGSFFYYLYLVVFSPVIIVMNLMAMVLDIFDKKREVVVNYEAVFKKK